MNRCGVEGTVEFTDHLGFYRVKYPVKGEPLVSILIPNKDQRDTLAKCINSVLEKTVYKNYEIIIIENNSAEQETFEYYANLAANDKVKIIYWKNEFNYSAINNFGFIIQAAITFYYSIMMLKSSMAIGYRKCLVIAKEKMLVLLGLNYFTRIIQFSMQASLWDLAALQDMRILAQTGMK